MAEDFGYLRPALDIAAARGRLPEAFIGYNPDPTGLAEPAIPLGNLVARQNGPAQDVTEGVNTPAVNTANPARRPLQIHVIDDDPDRSVDRELRGFQVFMIAIGGILGIGLYVKAGQILRLAGPLAVLLSFFIDGLLACGVMQCISELLSIWPIPGALHVFVQEFVNYELGIAVGIAYWFTYSVSFAALITATAGEAQFWSTPKPLQGTILLGVVPFTLLFLNALKVKRYGWIEVVFGCLKLSFLIAIIGCMIAINEGAGQGRKIGYSLMPKVTVHDTNVTFCWPQAFLMSLSIAAFQYIGVEIIAAAALEARIPTNETPSALVNSGRSFKWLAILTPISATVAYMLAGGWAMVNVPWDDPGLPRMSWATFTPTADNSTRGTTGSIFVLAAEQSGIPKLAEILNLFIVFTALSCASTNLYVASRALYSVTREYSINDRPWYSPKRFLSSLGRTSEYHVPGRALLASCFFLWVSFLYLASKNGPATSIGTLLDVLSDMGSVGVVIVWACECWAYIRYRKYLNDPKYNHREYFQSKGMSYVLPRKGTPLLAYLSLSGCLFILTVANSAFLWSGFHLQPFLSNFLALICFLALWIILTKIRKGYWRPRLENLENINMRNKVSTLNHIRASSTRTGNNERRNRAEGGVRTLWGLL